MLRLLRSMIAPCLLLATLASAPLSAEAKPGNSTKSKKILFFTRSQGFEHSTVKARKDEEPFALGVLSALGTPLGWEVVHTKDGSLITAEYLAGFDAIVFLTTGDLTAPRAKANDGKPVPAEDLNQRPMTPEGKAALLAAVAGGKGFLALHNASDTFHSEGDRWANQPAEALDPYIAMLGGEFVMHGEQQAARVRVVDSRFPGLRDVPASFELHEEWYALKNLAPDLHAVLVIESEAMKGDMYNRPAYPVAWARKHGKGRVFYSALGHREDVWTLPMFQKMLVGGMQFVLGQANGDVKPNVTKVAPRYQEVAKKP